MDAKPRERDARDPLDQQDSQPPRKPYTTPRLTKYGSIVTQTAGPVPVDLSGAIGGSDRALKEGLAPVDPRRVLAGVVALPMATWSYKGEIVRHMGPMAQDFSAAFGLGTDDRHIHFIDASGVALAALQGLHALVQAQTARLTALERELAALRAALGEPGAEAGEIVGVGPLRR